MKVTISTAGDATYHHEAPASATDITVVP